MPLSMDIGEYIDHGWQRGARLRTVSEGGVAWRRVAEDAAAAERRPGGAWLDAAESLKRGSGGSPCSG